MSEVYVLSHYNLVEQGFATVLLATSKEILERARYVLSITQYDINDDSVMPEMDEEGYCVDKFELIDSLDHPLVQLPKFLSIGGTIDILEDPDTLTVENIKFHVHKSRPRDLEPFQLWVNNGMIAAEFKMVIETIDGESIQEFHDRGSTRILEEYFKFRAQYPEEIERLQEKIRGSM